MNTSSTQASGTVPAVVCNDWFASVLWVITNPSCWLQNYGYAQEWDDELNRLMRVECFANITEHTARIGGHEVWIANHPYASFTLRRHDVRPSRTTIYRAQKKLMRDLFSLANNSGQTQPPKN